MKFILWFLAISASQFYVFKSGVPQPSHLLLILIFSYFLFADQRNIYSIFSYKYVKPVILFFLYALFVNIFFAVINFHISFIFSILYFLFGLLTLVFVLFSLAKNESNFKPIIFSLYAGLALLFSLTLLEIGRFDFFPRFNAFFNDPNQMAFWALCVAASFFLLSSVYKIKIIYVASASIMLVFIILSSASRSALVGLLPMLLGLIILNKDYFGSVSTKLFGMILGLFFTSYFIYTISGLEQTQYLMDRFVTTDTDQQLSDRGYDRFADYYQYLFFGAGQGADFRFNSTHEIHSTWAGIFFYYGLIGFYIFLHFILKIFFKLSFAEKFIYLSPLIYGFSTFGARSPIFWVFIAIAIFVVYKRVKPL
ncbi:hypothetical protein [Nitrincola tapanii]|uniref:O-antigen ligase domain-containing protein n=1 Tax=Nitrincola tapanii TaxID=1708751 RepID=A0A5A9W512_9GAMM|nr:hypothetical protein [Nitrincola tapanii]KAA0875742.1 hypothetical protein E1H14_03370 [Nitrincola tapanii]